MIKTTKWTLVVIFILLFGCATNVKKASINNEPLMLPEDTTRKIVLNVTGSPIATESGDWEQLKGVWRSAMKSSTRSIGAEFEVQEGDPNITSTPGILVVVKVKDYRFISQGARHSLGVFIGNAYIDSVVGFFDMKTGKRIGVRSYKTSSTAWEGIFSAMTEQQIQGICNEIISDIKTR